MGELITHHFSSGSKYVTSFLPVAINRIRLNESTWSSCRIICDFHITRFTRSNRFFRPFRSRATTRSDNTSHHQWTVSCILYYNVCETFPLPSLIVPKSNVVSFADMTACFSWAETAPIDNNMAVKIKMIRFIVFLHYK